MIILKNLKAVLFKYIKTFEIANIEKKSYFFVIFLTILTVILDAAGISILLPIGEYVLNYQSKELPNTYAWKILKKVFLYLGLKPNIELLVGFAIIIVTLRQSVVFIRAVAINKITFKAVKDFREKLFVKFLRQDLYYIKYYSTGVYNNIINEEVNKVGRAIVLPLENVSGIILIISYLCLMMFISIKATLIVMIFMLLTGLGLKNILYYVERTSGNIIKINNKFSQNLIDRLIAVKLIRVSNKLSTEEIQNKTILNDQYINNLNLAKIQRFIDCAVEPVLLMVTIPVIIIAIKLSFPLAKLGVFIILLARFIPIFKVTINTVQSYFAFYPTIDNMLKLIDEIDSQKEKRSGNLNAPKKIHKIEFQNIYFKYDKTNKYVLSNFSCVIKGGQINVLLGSSGSGKTTVVNMIPRLLEPDRGKIFINDISLKNINADMIREICSYVEQKPIFIRGSILEHISYNIKKLNRKKIEEAAKLANAHKFIMNLPESYNYKLGESGVGLSGGQLQRLDITRGLAAEKPLIILDEPTSNLDSKNTRELFLTLKKINKIKKTTILIVSHDKSILNYCNNIIKI